VDVPDPAWTHSNECCYSAMNMPEEQAGGQPGAPAQQQPGSAVQRGPSSGGVRRR